MKISIYNDISQIKHKNYITIRDDESSMEIDPNKQYILIFTSGKNTLKVFKQIYVLDVKSYAARNIIFVVKNLQLFLYKIKEFRNIKIELNIMKRDREVVDGDLPRKKKYISMENKINKTSEKGVEISFNPNIHSSIKTSLLYPQLYKAEESLTTKIFREMLQNKSVKARELVDKYKSSETEGVIASLISFGLIKQKGDHLVISDDIK